MTLEALDDRGDDDVEYSGFGPGTSIMRNDEGFHWLLAHDFKANRWIKTAKTR